LWIRTWRTEGTRDFPEAAQGAQGI